MAEYLKQCVIESMPDLVVAPTVNYNYYPAFVEYPGSTSLRLETARDLMIDICTSLNRFGPRHFYALNTGVSTISPLEKASENLVEQGIVLRYSVFDKLLEKVLPKPDEGGHAGEVETSIMLYVAPEVANMSKAVRDFIPGSGKLTRDPNNKAGVYSPSGVWGDATLATKEKGEVFVRALVEGICRDIERLRLI
jgi:creatinine amidohydrolase